MLKLFYMLVSFIFLKHIILLQYQANALTSSEDTVMLKRFKRDTSSEFTDIYNDENGDVIPGNDGFEYKSFAQQAAESFQSMWRSITDSLKHAMDALRGFFRDDSYEMYTHEDYEDQERLKIIETYKKKVKDNEIVM
uniref:Secreted protein n=1 Tax=Glossina pallidipes TaxID=7398 RepID=A0A1A9ZTM2_GLOPL